VAEVLAVSGFMRALMAGIIDREGNFSDHPADRGGPTRFGITEATARANGYTGDMRALPRALAEQIYAQRYVTGPGFDRVAGISERIAEELADSGVNFGPTVPSVWLQRWLNGFNRRGRDYADLRVDGALGPVTLAALKAFLDTRTPEGEAVLFAALNCSQGARYLELAEGRQQNEEFLYGWVRGRVAEHLK